MNDIWLVGIGTGNVDHITREGARALRSAGVILIPHKGEGREDLAELRLRLLRDIDAAQVPRVSFDMPQRDQSLPYKARVEAWHDDIARRWHRALAGKKGPAALMVWGDPSLYDSTLRIASRLTPAPNIRVIPGITALQALTAAHAIPLNTIDGSVSVTTGRRLREGGWPEHAETLAVMLDGACSFEHLPRPEQIYIWWGAFLAMPEQILISGRLNEVAPRIIAARAEARARHGWLMDTYLLRRDGHERDAARGRG